jgi:uncharacterized protein YndB with AHSA1/START domain
MHLTETIEVAAPPATVWAVLADLGRWPEWTGSISTIELVGGDHLAPGLQAHITQPQVPSTTWTVTEVVPGTSFKWATKSLRMAETATHRITPLGNGSKVTLTLDIEGATSVFLRPFIRRASERNLRMEADGLKRRAEAAARSHRKMPLPDEVGPV